MRCCVWPIIAHLACCMDERCARQQRASARSAASWNGTGRGVRTPPSPLRADRPTRAAVRSVGHRCGGLRLTGRRFRRQGRASVGAPVRGGLVGGRAEGPPSGTHVGSATGTPRYSIATCYCRAVYICDGPLMGTRRSSLRTSHRTARTDLPLLLGDGRRLVQLLVPLRARRAVRAHRARRLRDARRERALLRR